LGFSNDDPKPCLKQFAHPLPILTFWMEVGEKCRGQQVKIVVMEEYLSLTVYWGGYFRSKVIFCFQLAVYMLSIGSLYASSNL
jgi:hypothetical protein